MILKKNKNWQDLPEAVEPSSTTLWFYPEGDPEKNPNSYPYCVPMTSAKELLECIRKADVVGLPNLYTIIPCGEKSRLGLYPKPAQAYYARLRYCPAMKEI